MERKKFYFRLTVCVFLLILTNVMYFFAYNEIMKEKIQKRDVSIEYSCLADIDGINKNLNSLILNGWMLFENVVNENLNLVLRDASGNEVFVMPVELTSQERGNEKNKFEVVVDKGVDKSLCYEILIDIGYRSIEDKKDEDLVLSEKKWIKISSGKYLYNEKLYGYNPLEFNAPTITSEEYKDVVTLGQVLAYDMNKQMYIYYYDNRLVYFVHEKNDMFHEWCYVPVHLYTLEYSKLPEDSKADKFENKDFYFVDNCVSDASTEYDIASMELPDAYVPTYVNTGLYNMDTKEWIWDVSSFIGNIVNQ